MASIAYSFPLPLHVYDSIRSTLPGRIRNSVGSFEENFNRAVFILGCENWDGYDFKALLQLLCITNLGY